MPQHPARCITTHSTSRRARTGARPTAVRRWSIAVGLVAVAALGGCGGNSERTLPEARPPAVDSLTPQQIVTEAQRALSQATSVHIVGSYRENDKPVLLDIQIAAGDKATGKVASDGSTVEIRRIGDKLYVKGDDKFLAALGPKAQATKGKWLVGPIAQADRGLANLTDLGRFAGTLAPGKGTLTKDGVRTLAGKQAVVVRSSTGARLYVANTGPAYPLRVERTGDGGDATGFIDYSDYDAKVDVTAPGPTVDLASVSS